MTSPLLALIAAASLANGSAVAVTRSDDALPGAGVAAQPAKLVAAKAPLQAGTCVVVNGGASAVRGHIAKAKCKAGAQLTSGTSGGGVFGMRAGSAAAALAGVAAAAAGLGYAVANSGGAAVSGG